MELYFCARNNSARLDEKLSCSDALGVTSMRTTGFTQSSISRRLATIAAAADQTFSSLKNRNYLHLWTGLMGGWMAMQMQQVARGYLAYTLTGTAFTLGLVTLSMGIPRMFLSPLGGVLADRFPKRKVVLVTQTMQALIALAHALLLQFGLMRVWVLIALGFVQGTAFALNMPARQAFIPEIVGSGPQMANAIALNNAGMNLTRVIGPSVAGLLLAMKAVGVKGVFYIMTLCYLWAVYATSRIDAGTTPATSTRKRVSQDVGAGFSYIVRNGKLLALMSLGFIPLAIGMPYQNLMTVFALKVMNIGSRGLGVLLTAAGVGGLLGSLLIAYLSDYRHKARLQQLYGVAFGLLLVTFAFFSRARMLPVVLPVLVLLGLVGDGYMSINSTLIMTNTDRAVYGRVMGVYMIIQSVRPVTVLPIAALADRIGAPLTVGIAGAIVTVFIIAVATLYPRYREIG